MVHLACNVKELIFFIRNPNIAVCRTLQRQYQKDFNTLKKLAYEAKNKKGSLKEK